MNTMQNGRQGVFRFGTIILLAATALVCMFYALIFLDPQVAVNPFKPLLPPTATLVAGEMPATPQTGLETPVAPGTATRETWTPKAGATTRAYSAAFAYRPVVQGTCRHFSSTVVMGTVWDGTQPESDIRVRISWEPNGPRAMDDQITRPQADGSLTYIFVLKRNGSFGRDPADWFVWIVGPDGQAASDPTAAHVVTNNLPLDNPASCWLAVVDFVR